MDSFGQLRHQPHFGAGHIFRDGPHGAPVGRRDRKSGEAGPGAGVHPLPADIRQPSPSPLVGGPVLPHPGHAGHRLAVRQRRGGSDHDSRLLRRTDV